MPVKACSRGFTFEFKKRAPVFFSLLCRKINLSSKPAFCFTLPPKWQHGGIKRKIIVQVPSHRCQLEGGYQEKGAHVFFVYPMFLKAGASVEHQAKGGLWFPWPLEAVRVNAVPLGGHRARWRSLEVWSFRMFPSTASQGCYDIQPIGLFKLGPIKWPRQQ